MLPASVGRAGFTALVALIAIVGPLPGSRADRADFAGAKQCASCHQQAHAVWQKSAHARATATLGKQTSRRCMACHSTGDAPAGRAYFAGVQCEACHGERESIDPDVLKTIEAFYPEDRATGFSEGDLRGWFWIEVGAPDPAGQ